VAGRTIGLCLRIRWLGPSPSAARAGLAHFTGATGDLVAARDQNAALLPTLDDVLGPRHPDILRARADLVGCTALASGSE
jgi:hypothetical protein